MLLLPLRREEPTFDHLERPRRRLRARRPAPRLQIDLAGPRWEERGPREEGSARDVAAFANAGGGDNVFGVEEGRDADGKANGGAVALPGDTIGNLDALERRWVQLLEAGLDPRLSPKVRLRAVDSEGDLRAAFELSESWADRLAASANDRLAKIVTDEPRCCSMLPIALSSTSSLWGRRSNATSLISAN